MVPLRVIVATICAASAARVSTERESGTGHLDVDSSVEHNSLAVDFNHAVSRESEAFEVDVNGSRAWVKPKLKLWDVAAAEQKFRSSEEPLLIPGEKVDMAFFDEYRDYMLFTNWRLIVVDGEATALSGYGKKAVANEITYKSTLWYALLWDQESVKTVLAGNTNTDRDVEVIIAPKGTELEFSRDIGNAKLFEIGAYLREKIKTMGKLATNSDIPWCKENEMKWGWHEKGFCGKQLGATRPDELRRFDRDLGRWTVPGIGIAKESDKSVEDILGPGLSLLEKGEQVLYKLTETWNFYGRYDDMIVTDKQIITVDEKLAKGKKQYSTFAYPPGMDFDLIWKNMYSWEIHTAKRTGTKRSWNSIDAHIGIHVTARSFHFDLDKTAVPTSKLFEYHTKLQNKVAAASQYFR